MEFAPLPIGDQPPADMFDSLSEESLTRMEKLARLGYLERSFDFCGYNFAIRTLYPIEEAAAALAVQEFRNTLREPEVWGNVQVGLALMAVDHDPDFCPPVSLKVRPQDFARARFNWVSQNLMQPVLDYIYAEYLDLLEERNTVIREAQDLSERSLQAFWPGAGSSTEQATSDEPTTTDTPPSTPST